MAAQPPESTFPLIIDPLLGMPEVALWRRELEAGRWAAAANGLAAISDLAVRELRLVRLVADLPRLDVFDAWVRAEPQNPLAHLVRGAHGTEWAWAARGSGRAEQVEASAWDTWFARLRDADDDLNRAASLSPSDGAPWGRLVVTARALEIGMDERWLRYRRATRNDPFLPLTADDMLQALCRKWSGSHEAMFEFARSTSELAPPGHVIHRLVARAISERKIDCATVEEWRDLRAATPEFAEMLAAAAAKSIDLVSFYDPPGAIDPQKVRTRNEFAFAYAQMADLPRLKRQLEAIGSNVTQSPWGDTAEVRRLRKLVDLP